MIDQSLASSVFVALIAPIAALGVAWAVGHRLTFGWNVWQKRREQTLSASTEFYRLYGEFFAIWKLWNAIKETTDDGKFDETRWALLERAASAEASMESLMVRLSSERNLSGNDLTILGCFRQAFQRLRKQIRRSEYLDWYHSDHPEYLAYKRLAVSVARLVATADVGQTPTVEQARYSLESITSNKWEKTWKTKYISDPKSRYLFPVYDSYK